MMENKYIPKEIIKKVVGDISFMRGVSEKCNIHNGVNREKERILTELGIENCEHIVGDKYETCISDNDGFYVSYTCPKCGDNVKDYYDLANRDNESKEQEEPTPDVTGDLKMAG